MASEDVLFDVERLLAERPESFKDYVPYTLSRRTGNTLFLAPDLSAKATPVESETKGVYSEVRFEVDGSTFRISFDPGPSEDPSFVIESERLENRALINGTILYVSSSGAFYSVGRINELFETRRKFTLRQMQLEEVTQPFLLVGKTCSTTGPAEVYSDRCDQGRLIATLPKGMSVHVLLMENGPSACPRDPVPGEEDVGDPVFDFLVSTPFGLVGWVSSTCGHLARPGYPLGCIRFLGD